LRFVTIADLESHYQRFQIENSLISIQTHMTPTLAKEQHFLPD